MNPVIDILMKRKSMRVYEQKEIDAKIKAGILKATLRAPVSGREDFEEMYIGPESQMPKEKSKGGVTNLGQAIYLRKFSADFSVEMSRSARATLKEWTK